MSEEMDFSQLVAQEDEINLLRKQVEQLEAELECAKADYLNACVTIANMHRAAVGEVTGPKRGVVEDIEDLRLERDALLASKPLGAGGSAANDKEKANA